MTHHETDALEALRAELTAAAPSPEFAARVREQIDLACEQRAASWWPTWRWLAPAAVVAAGLIAVVAIPRPQPQAPEQTTAATRIESPTAISATEAPAAERGPEAPGTSAVAKAPADKREPENPRTGEPEDLFPEVLTNQPEILRALWARVQPLAAVAGSTETLPAVVSQIVVPPIEVNPVVVKWMVEPPVRSLPSGTSPVIRRVTAETAERSEK